MQKMIEKINWTLQVGVPKVNQSQPLGINMTRAKETSAYPKIFLDIADALTEDKTRKFEMEFESRAAAMSMRLDFYMFKSAAIKEGLAKPGGWPEIKAFYMDVPKKEDWKGVATIMHCDNSPSAVRMQKAYDLVMKGVNSK